MAVYWLKFGAQTGATATSGLTPTLTVFRRYDGVDMSPGPGITQPIANYGLYQFEYSSNLPIEFEADGFTTGLSTGDRFIYGTVKGSDVNTYSTDFTTVGTLITNTGTTLVAVGNTQGIINTNAGLIGPTLIANGATIVAIGNTMAQIRTNAAATGTTLIAFGATLVAVGNTILSLTPGTTVPTAFGTTASSFGTTSTMPGTLFGYAKRIQEVMEGNQTFNKSTGVFNIYSRTGTLLASKTLSQDVTGSTKV